MLEGYQSFDDAWCVHCARKCNPEWFNEDGELLSQLEDELFPICNDTETDYINVCCECYGWLGCLTQYGIRQLADDTIAFIEDESVPMDAFKEAIKVYQNDREFIDEVKDVMMDKIRSLIQ